jgi:hypothetical protein
VAVSSTEIRELSDVTLVSVTGVDSDATLYAMQRCLSGLRFARAILIASAPPSTLDPRVEYIRIGPMNYAGYSRFILKELHNYITTSHALVVQADGFVINADRWNPDWLRFDYIGAPFPPVIKVGKYDIELTNRVGNGGFSLRSRRLLQLVSEIKLETLRYPTINEDMIVCHLLHDYLVGKGSRFADIETAADFSIDERPFGRTFATTFGFHGKHNLLALQNAEKIT